MGDRRPDRVEKIDRDYKVLMNGKYARPRDHNHAKYLCDQINYDDHIQTSKQSSSHLLVRQIESL